MRTMKHKTTLAAAMSALLIPSLALAEPKTAPTDTSKPAATAASNKEAVTPAKSDKTKRYPLNGTVVSATKTTLTLKGGMAKGVQKPDRIYEMTPETVILNGDKPATLADVKTGQKVGGYVEELASGKIKVLKLNVNPKPKASKTPKTK